MANATMQIEPLDATFGAVVRDVSIRNLDEPTAGAVHDAWIEFGLLIFPDQHLTQLEQDAFARRFGELEFTATPLTNVRKDGSLRRDTSHVLNKSLRANEQWHHDSTYMPIQAKGAVFSAEIIPSSGGATGFADMRAAYEALDSDTQDEISDLTAFHSRRYSMERAGLKVEEDESSTFSLYGFTDGEPPLRPLVKIHPETGRPNLTIGQHAHAIPGLSADASEELLDGLNSRACVGPRILYHDWAVGDAVLWDNRRLMHRATSHDPDEPRRMWHTRIAGDPSSEAALNATGS